MGYTTDFEGQFKLTTPLTPDQVAYLNMFSGTRRMKRDAVKAEAYHDPLREAVGLPIGIDGGFFVGADQFGEYSGQARTKDILDYNRPPAGQPSLWCQWVATEDGTAIEWDGGEKFYSYVQWLEYIIRNFLTPWGATLNGEVKWHGEDDDDHGKIIVTDNKVTTKQGHVTYE